MIIVFHPQISFGLVWFGLVWMCFFFFNFRYGGMTVTKETKIIVSSPSRTQDLCFGKRRLNFCASGWLVEVSLEVVKPPALRPVYAIVVFIAELRAIGRFMLRLKSTGVKKGRIKVDERSGKNRDFEQKTKQRLFPVVCGKVGA